MKVLLTPKQLARLIRYAESTGELARTPITLSADSIRIYYRYISQLQESARRNSN